MSRWYSSRWRGFVLLALLATALLAGCSAPQWPWQAHSPAPLPDAQQILYVSLRAGVNEAELDPGGLRDVRSDMAHIAPLLYSTLFTFDARLRPVPALAASYSISADGLRYTFHLRPDARFADGTPLTSADVAFSIQRLLAPCGGSSYGFVFFSIQGALAYATTQTCNPPTLTLPPLIGHALLTPDPQTLVIVLAQPDGALLTKLAEPYSGVVEQSVVQRYGDNWTKHLADGGGQGTSGMYRLASVRSVVNEGTQLTLTRASRYWGAAPRLREVIVRSYEPAIEQAPRGDDLILGSGSPPAFRRQGAPTLNLSKLPGYHEAPARDEDYVLLDPTAPGLGDLRVRQALALAVNRAPLAALIGGAATNHLIPPGTGAYPATLSGPIATAPLSGDTTRARALWQSYVVDKCGGAASRCPVIVIWVVTSNIVGPDSFELRFTRMLMAQWQAALPGIRVTLSYNNLDLLQPLPASQATGYFNWDEDYPDPQDWMDNLSGYSGAATPILQDAAAGALVKQAEATRDPQARLALYQQAENTLLNDAVIIPIAQEQDGWAVKPTVANFPTNPEPYIPPSVWARIYLTAPDQ